MPWRHEGRARRAASGLVAAWLGGAAVAGEADPRLALLEILINGRSTQRIEAFVVRDGLPWAPPAQWRALGVTRVEGAPDAEAVSAAALTDVRHQLDLGGQKLALELPPDPAALTVIERGLPATAAALEQDRGAILNYDLNVLHADGRTRGAGLLDGRAFGPFGLVEHSMLAYTGDGTRLRRLNTSVTQADPGRLQRWRVGDLVSGGLGWTRPVRLLGAQLATDFALRPGLVTTPTPQLSGNAAVPSTVDVLVNGVRQLSQPVEAGRFEVRQLPVVSGLGEVSVVVRDALGRESVQTLAFYTASRQLARGMSAYAVDVGRVRRGFGGDDDRYGATATTATWRHGLSDRTTLEAHGEATAGTTAAGAGAVVTLGAAGVLSAALAASGGEGRQGTLASLGLERQTADASLQVALTHASPDYRDVATAQGDPALRHSLRVGAGWQLGRHGTLGIAALDVRNAASQAGMPAQRTRLVSATHGRSLPFGVQAYASAYRDLMPGGGHGVTVGLVLPFGTRGSASAAATRSARGSALSTAAGESATRTGEVGWRVQRDERRSGDAPNREFAQAEWLAAAARVSIGVERLAGRGAQRFGAQGALVALDGRLHATQLVPDSVAVVDVDGQPGVTVLHENRPIGRTGSDGRLLVPGLLSFQRNRLAIDPLDLPLDADMADVEREVTPGDRSGVRVRFALDRRRAALVLLQDAAGRALPLGARVLADGALEAGLVGHEGLAYLRGLADDQRVTVAWPQGRCVAQVAWRARQADTGRIGPVRCE